MKQPNLIVKEQLVSLVRHLIGSNPNPEDPQPPGPWGPVIRKAFDRMRYIAGPFPEPWSKHSLLSDPLSWVALNPQPLPPGETFALFVAQEIIDKAILLQEVADGMRQDAQEQGIIIVGGIVSRYVDELCPRLPRWWPKWHKWPVPPGPDPDPRWAVSQWLVMGVQFEQQAMNARHPGLQQVFMQASEKLIETGLSQLG